MNKTLKTITSAIIPLIIATSSAYSQKKEFFFKAKFDSVPNLKSESIVEETLINYFNSEYEFAQKDQSSKYLGIDIYKNNNIITKIELVDDNKDNYINRIIISNFKKNTTIECIDSNNDKVFDTVKIDLYNNNKIITLKDNNSDRIIDYITQSE